MPQPQPCAQTQGQPHFSASTAYPQLQQPGQQGSGMPQQNVTVQQMQPPLSQPAQPQFLPGTYPQQQAGNHPILQQQQNVPHAQQPFSGSASAGQLPQQPPQSQPQPSSTSQTSPPDGSTTQAMAAPQFQQDTAGKHNVYSTTTLSERLCC